MQIRKDSVSSAAAELFGTDRIYENHNNNVTTTLASAYYLIMRTARETLDIDRQVDQSLLLDKVFVNAVATRKRVHGDRHGRLF